MPSAQQIKNRINGISKTKQITKSMRLVSSAKIQKARPVFETGVPYLEHAAKLMDLLSSSYESRKNIYFNLNSGAKKTGIVAISTDRGLCGAYNMNVARRTISLAKEKKSTHIITVGSKINSTLKREKINVDSSYIGISETPIFEEAEMLSTQLIQLYNSGEIDEIYVVYTHFTSMLEQNAVAEKILPYTPKNKHTVAAQWSFEPAAEDVIFSLVPVYTSAYLYGAVCESALCEQSARVGSMDAAARNSDELVKKLTVQYNQMRQAGITNQIIEIMGGVSATKK